MDSFLLLRRLVAAIVFKGQTVSDYWWSRRTIFLTASTTTDLGISFFLIFVRRVLEKLGLLVDQNCLERNLSALLLRTLVVSRRQQSESIEVALEME